MTVPWQVLRILFGALAGLFGMLAAIACRVIGVSAMLNGVIRAWFALQGESIAMVGPPSWSAACFALLLGIISYALPDVVRTAIRNHDG
jgi:hypothetical protein